jgi:nanoRNase/pAp phosphatase (c-di-AMP/oligoRNAs hydrolase)
VTPPSDEEGPILPAPAAVAPATASHARPTAAQPVVDPTQSGAVKLPEDTAIVETEHMLPPHVPSETHAQQIAQAATTPTAAYSSADVSGAEPREAGPVAPPARVRYFEDATELISQTLDSIEGDDIIGWAHDRIDPDTMGANGLLWYLLQERGKRYTCYYSKRMSFLMNRSLATNFMPNGLLRRCEATENLSEIAHKSDLIVVLDATSPEIMTDFAHLLSRSEELREKRILFVDHHRRGQSDLEDLPNTVGVRYQGGQATSAIMLHVIRNLGVDLAAAGEDGFRLAVVARAGIETDLIGVDPKGYTDSTVDALNYLDSILGDRGKKILDKLRSIKHPLSWYRKLGQALAEVDKYDSTVAVAGLGVISDTGIVPFVANRLMDLGPFKTTIVFGIVYDLIEGQIISVDVDASGRSSQDTEVVLPDLFHEVFFVTDPSGRKTSKGGGRANMLMGDYSGAGASVPLDYWRHLGTKSADEKIQILHRLAWPAEFLRIRHLLCSRISSLKPEEVRSLVPIPGLEGL